MHVIFRQILRAIAWNGVLASSDTSTIKLKSQNMGEIPQGLGVTKRRRELEGKHARMDSIHFLLPPGGGIIFNSPTFSCFMPVCLRFNRFLTVFPSRG